MADPSFRKSGLRRLLFGRGALIGLLLVGAPALTAVLISHHRDSSDREIEQWFAKTGGAVATLADQAGTGKASVRAGEGVTVSSEQALRRALEDAKDGDVIRLLSGSYPQIVIAGIVKSGQVTITSADPQRPAEIAQLLIRQSAGLTLRDLELAADSSSVSQLAVRRDMDEDQSASASDESRTKHLNWRGKRKGEGAAPHRRTAGGRIAGRFPFLIVNSERIVLDRLNVHGPANDREAAYRITAMMIRNSREVEVSNSKFHNLWNGLAMLDLQGVVIRDNQFSDIRTDGLHGGDVSDAEIAGNIFTGFHPAPGDHPDGIQLWTTPKKAVLNNISIHDNMIVRGAGSPTQGIFLRDLRNSYLFHNVNIYDNLVMGGLYNGIAINNVEGGRIEGNRVVNYPDRPRSWIRIDNSRDVQLKDNRSSHFIISKSSDVKQSGNKVDRRGKIDEAKDVKEWLDAKPGRRAYSELQTLLATGQ